MQKIKIQNNKGKILFKLNDNLFDQNLPQLFQRKFKGKQNKFISFVNDSGFSNGLKKKIKIFNMPKKFKKNNNKIQDNMTVLNKTSTSYHIGVSKTCSSSFYKGSTQNSVSSSKFDFDRTRSNVSGFGEEFKKYNLQPKTLQQIQKGVERRYKKKQQIVKNQINSFKLKHVPMRQSVSELLKSHKQAKMLSRFTLLQLKSYYSSILNFATGDLNKFKYAFEIMLNLANVTVRQTIMDECLKQLVTDGISFQKFLQSFTDIQQKLRKQAIIDYFEILLEEIKKQQISYEEFIKTFQGRMKKQIANQLTDLLYQKTQKQFTQKISKKQIHSLCYTNQHFCTIFYALNHQNMLDNRFKSNDQN